MQWLTLSLATRDVERQLYLTDLETLLELLHFDRENALPIPRS